MFKLLFLDISELSSILLPPNALVYFSFSKCMVNLNNNNWIAVSLSATNDYFDPKHEKFGAITNVGGSSIVYQFQ
jgi:hypothetical protein